MDYNTTVVSSSQKMYRTAQLSNFSNMPSFSSIVELNMPFSPPVLTDLCQWLKKQASDTRCRYIFQAKDITRTYRNQSRSSSLTDSEGCLDVSDPYMGANCAMIPSYHGNTSADVTNNQAQRIQYKFYSIHYGIMYVIEQEYK